MTGGRWSAGMVGERHRSAKKGSIPGDLPFAWQRLASPYQQAPTFVPPQLHELQEPQKAFVKVVSIHAELHSWRPPGRIQAAPAEYVEESQES